MDTESRIELIRQVGEEIITEEDLRTLLETKDNPIAYDGFEPSGNIHIAQGILRSININKMTDAGCRFKLWVADWFALMNNKLGGDLDKIKVTGNYFVEVWKACGMNLGKVEFLWASDVMGDTDYWKKVIEIAGNSTVNRITRCSQIMGRSEGESLSAAQIFYPCMQCADIFHLNADIAQLGMDQRKVNMLAREVGDKLFGYKPVAVHHHMLMGLGQPMPKINGNIIPDYIKILNNLPNTSDVNTTLYQLWGIIENIATDRGFNYLVKYNGNLYKSLLLLKNVKDKINHSKNIEENMGKLQSKLRIKILSFNKELKNVYNSYEEERVMSLKMSKSKPDTAIFMTDSEEDIKRKIGKAYCPEKVVEDNPILEYCKYLVFEKFDALEIKRPAKFGGDLVIDSYDGLVKVFESGQLHPMDLKACVAERINLLVKPVRDHFEKNSKAKKLLEKVKSFEVTR